MPTLCPTTDVVVAPEPDVEISELDRVRGIGLEPLLALKGGLAGETIGGVQKLKIDEPPEPVGVVGRPGETMRLHEE